eukprot:5279071-Pleurochrysis_carterae.AAC.1
MQERELREGSERRCGVERRRMRWPSAAGADLAASSGAPSARTLVRKPVRGDDTGVGVVVGSDALSASLPPVTFAGGVPAPRSQCDVAVLRGAVRSGR